MMLMLPKGTSNYANSVLKVMATRDHAQLFSLVLTTTLLPFFTCSCCLNHKVWFHFSSCKPTIKSHLCVYFLLSNIPSHLAQNQVRKCALIRRTCSVSVLVWRFHYTRGCSYSSLFIFLPRVAAYLCRCVSLTVSTLLFDVCLPASVASHAAAETVWS